MNAARTYSIRELIVELAGLEDAIRIAPAQVLDETTGLSVNPDLARLLRAERRVIGHLHRIPTTAFGQALPSPSPPPLAHQ